MARITESAVAAHYHVPDLARAILAGLEAAGADPENPTPRDLAPVDEFHTAGRATTLRCMQLMPIEAGMRVLDVGSGLGGACRHLASEHGCHATGIDLTPAFVETARFLTDRTGLSESCDFVEGSALDLPFQDAFFDAAISFHAAMNIKDRARLYAEMARVLRSGAPLCIFDVMKGSKRGMLYPVPWAKTPATSFLKTPTETRALLEAAGFEVSTEESQLEFALEFFREAFAKIEESGPPPLGLHLLTGAETGEKFANYVAAAEAGQIEPVILIARRR